MNKNYITLAKCASKIKKINKASDEETKQKTLESLFSLFVREKGLFLKFGQFLNQHKDSIDYTELTNIKLLDIDKGLQKIIHRTCEDNNLTIDSAIVYLGSIGLVIKAKSTANDTLAIKIQYPNIKKNLLKQFSALNSLSSMAPGFLNLDMKESGLLEGLKNNIESELDYKRECENSRKISNGIKNSVMRTMNPKLINEKTIQMDWVDGVNLNSSSTLTNKEREFVATNLLKQFHNSFFNNGFVQVDNQEDNFIYDKKSNQICLLDLGNCISISPAKRISILKIINSIQAQQDIDFIPLLENIGFNAKKLEHIRDFLPPLLEAIFAPYCSNMKFDLANYNLNKIVDNILGENKWWFRMAGNEEVFSLMRSFSLLLKTLSKLNVPLFFKMHLNNDLDINIQTDSNSLKVTKRVGGDYFSNAAKNLYIKIIENDVEKVFLTMPSGVLQDIENYINDEIKSKISQEGLSLNSIVHTAYENLLVPQELLHLKDDNKEVLIYLS